MSNKNDIGMYRLYKEYQDTLKVANKTLRSRQNANREIREKCKDPFKREDHQTNVNDITNWNSMVRDLEEDMRMMEMYLGFDDRVLLHRDYNNMKSMILNQNSYEGEVPFDTLYDECILGVEDIVCNVELQDEIIELLDKVLTQRQKQVVDMYYWQEMTQEKIAKELGIAQQNVSANLQNAIKTLRKHIDMSDICLDVNFEGF